MKVRITMTVDINSEEWDLNFGTGTKAADVRTDVQNYVENLVIEHLNNQDLLTPCTEQH